MEPATSIFHLLNPLPPKRKRLALGTRSTPNATGSSWDAAGWFPPAQWSLDLTVGRLVRHLHT